MLPSLSHPVSPRRTPPSTAPSTAPPSTGAPVTRYEQLPAELRLLVAETALRDSLPTPTLEPTALFASLERGHSDLHAALRAAGSLVRAFGTASGAQTGPAAFTAALHRLRQAPPQYLGLCWDAAWRAYGALAPSLPLALSEQLLCALLRAAGGYPALQPPVLDRALALSAGRAGRWPSHELAEQMLQLAAFTPDIAPGTWRRLLQRLAQTPLGPQVLATPGLDDRQRAELQILRDCKSARDADGQQIRALLQRIDTDASPACRQVALGLLKQRWPVLDRGDRAHVARYLRGMLGRTDIAARTSVMQLLLRCTPRGRATARLLQKRTPALPAADALRLLAEHCGSYGPDPQDSQRLVARFGDILAQSRVQSQGQPQRHAGALRAAAGAVVASLAADEATRRQLMALILDACTALAPQHRPGVLALLQHGAWALPAGAWQRAWDDALQAIGAMARADRTAPEPRCLVQALARALRVQGAGRRDAVLRLLRPVLEALSPEARAHGLCEIAQAPWSVHADQDSGRHLMTLLELCAALPCHLRSRPLAALERLAQRLPERAVLPALERLRTRTATALRAWSTGQPAPQA